MIQETLQADLFKQQTRESLRLETLNGLIGTNEDHFLIIKEQKLTTYLAQIA